MGVSGSCLCGRFAFELDGELRLASHCHCGHCRKAHGSAFATYVGAERLEWRSGAGEQSAFASSAEMARAFCPTCGSKVPGPDGVENVFVPMGLLDGDPGARVGAHIFVRDKAPWVEITDGLPVFDAYPPGIPDPKLATRPRPEGASDGAIASSCLCGAVAWEQSKPPERMGHCHCSRCRKVRSAAFSTQLFAPHDQFRWVSGRERVQEYQLPGAHFFGNSFCGDCGSPAPRDVEGAPMIMSPAGGLDDDPVARPSAHIYVASKAPWIEITDDLLQLDEMPSELPGG